MSGHNRKKGLKFGPQKKNFEANVGDITLADYANSNLSSGKGRLRKAKTTFDVVREDTRAAKMFKSLRLKDKRTFEQLDVPMNTPTMGLTEQERSLAIIGFNKLASTTMPLANGLECLTTLHPTQKAEKKSRNRLLPQSQCNVPLMLENEKDFENKVNEGRSQTIVSNITERNNEPQIEYNDHQWPQIPSKATAIDNSALVPEEITKESDIDSSSNDCSLILTCELASEESIISGLNHTITNSDSSFLHSQVKSSTAVQSTEMAENPIVIGVQSKEISVDDHENIRIGPPESDQETNEYEEPEVDEPNDIDDAITGNKRKRRYDRKNFCIFCESPFSNFRRHILRRHKTEEPVAQYLALLECCPEGSKKKRNNILADLRRKGNFIHNQGLLKDPVKRVTHASELLPERRPPSNKKKSSEDFITCMYCYNLVSKKSFFKHIPSCKERPKNKIVGERDIENISEDDTERQRKCPNFAKRYGIDIRPVSIEVSKTMREKIIPSLMKDDVGKFAASDPLILAIADDFLSSRQKMAKDKYNITRKMRDAASLVMKVKEYDNSALTLKDCFNPLLVNTVIKSVQQLCGCNMESDEVKIIGMPARMAWIISNGGIRLIDNIICDERKTENEKKADKKKIDDFLCVFKRRWKNTISSNAEKSKKLKLKDKPYHTPT